MVNTDRPSEMLVIVTFRSDTFRAAHMQVQIQDVHGKNFLKIFKVISCFEPSQPLGVMSGLKKSDQSLKTNHNISTAQIKYFTTARKEN